MRDIFRYHGDRRAQFRMSERIAGDAGPGRRLPVAWSARFRAGPYWLLTAATVALSTVANPAQATSGTASSAAGWSTRRASRP